MIRATAKYLFKKKGKEYKYNLELPDNPTAHDISLAISLAVMKERNRARTRMGKFAPMYALSMKLFDIDQVTIENGEFLANTARIVLPKGNPDPRKDAYTLANQRNEEVKPVVLKCDNCNGHKKIRSVVLINDCKMCKRYNDFPEICFDFPEANISLARELCGMIDCPKCNGEGFIIWKLTNRVGRSFNNRLVIDIDGHDFENMEKIKSHAENLFGYSFRVAKTGNGYWLCGTHEYANADEWLYDNCRLLNPSLERKDLSSYIKQLIALDESTKKLIGGKEALTKKIIESELYHGFGEFDVIFTLISIKVKKHTLRDSKKFEGDKIVIVASL